MTGYVRATSQGLSRQHRSFTSIAAEERARTLLLAGATRHHRSSKPLLSLRGCRFWSENRGWSLPADAVTRLIAKVVSKPGAGSQLTGRSVLLRARGLAFSSYALGSRGRRPSPTI